MSKRIDKTRSQEAAKREAPTLSNITNLEATTSTHARHGENFCPSYMRKCLLVK